MSKNMKETIKELNKALECPEYNIAWVSNIAIAQMDSERWYREKNNKVGKHLDYKDRLTIANNGAKYFLELLKK